MGFGGCRDECFASAATVDDPLGIEFAVRLEDGVGIDLEVRDDVLHLRELVAGLQPTEPDRLLTCYTSCMQIGTPDRRSS